MKMASILQPAYGEKLSHPRETSGFKSMVDRPAWQDKGPWQQGNYADSA
jgi:hypothetical protein